MSPNFFWGTVNGKLSIHRCFGDVVQTKVGNDTVGSVCRKTFVCRSERCDAVGRAGSNGNQIQTGIAGVRFTDNAGTETDGRFINEVCQLFLEFQIAGTACDIKLEGIHIFFNSDGKVVLAAD